MKDFLENDAVIAAFCGGVGAFFRAFKKGSSILKSLCSSIVGVLCSIYLTDSIWEQFPNLNANAIAFLIGLVGLEFCEIILNYLSKIKPKTSE